MSKCAFSCCGNQRIGPRKKTGLAFYSFNDVPLPVSKHWTKIVARERRDPNYKPNPNSRICADHFASYEITPSKTLYSTAIPTLNIGPYDDTVILDEDNNNSEKDNFICVIENQITTQPSTPSIDYNDDNVICVIENQISLEPKPQSIDEQEIDIEEQLQWSLVGTSKHLNGLLHTKGPDNQHLDELLHTRGPERPTISPQLRQPFKDKQTRCVKDRIIILKSDDSESETETEIKDHSKRQAELVQQKPQIKIDQAELENSDDDINDTEFKDQFARFLKTYDRDKLINGRKKNADAKRKKIKQSKTIQNFSQALHKPNSPKLQLKPLNPNQLKTRTHKSILSASKSMSSPSKNITHQSVPTNLNQFITVMQQSGPAAPKHLIAIPQQLIESTVSHQFLETTQPIPIQLTKTAKIVTPRSSTTPMLDTAPQFATIKHIEPSKPIMVYDAVSPINGTTRVVSLMPSNVSLISSNFSLSGMKLSSVCLEENNTKTYYLRNILPHSAKLIIGSEPLGTQIVTQQDITLNDNDSRETNFIFKSESQDNEDYETIIVKTEGNVDY